MLSPKKKKRQAFELMDMLIKPMRGTMYMYIKWSHCTVNMLPFYQSIIPQ